MSYQANLPRKRVVAQMAYPPEVPVGDVVQHLPKGVFSKEAAQGKDSQHHKGFWEFQTNEPILDSAGVTCKGPIRVDGQITLGPSGRKPLLRVTFGAGDTVIRGIGGWNPPSVHIKRVFSRHILATHMQTQRLRCFLCRDLGKEVSHFYSNCSFWRKMNCENNQFKPTV